MAAETQYTETTGMQTISTANTNLDGTGTLSSAILTGASNGTLLNTVIVKAQVNTTHGMVRLFVYDGTNTRLIKEIEIRATTKSSIDSAFQVSVPLNFMLQSGYSIKASTEKAETFNVIIDGKDWAYYASSVRLESTKYTVYNAATTVSTANTNLDGTGALGVPLASSGTNLIAVTIKAKGSTTEGVVRLFLYDGTNTKLMLEVPVIAVTQSGTYPTFSRRIIFEGGFTIKSGWQLKASTEKAESFNIIPESLDITYPA